MRSLSKSIAWLCLLLTFASAVAFAAHHHSSAAEETKVYGLYRCPFRFPQGSFYSCTCAFRSGSNLSAEASFRKATTASLCPVGPPAS